MSETKAAERSSFVANSRKERSFASRSSRIRSPNVLFILIVSIVSLRVFIKSVNHHGTTLEGLLFCPSLGNRKESTRPSSHRQKSHTIQVATCSGIVGVTWQLR